MWLHQNYVQRHPVETAEVWTIVECMGRVSIPRGFVLKSSNLCVRQLSFLEIILKYFKHKWNVVSGLCWYLSISQKDAILFLTSSEWHIHGFDI